MTVICRKLKNYLLTYLLEKRLHPSLAKGKIKIGSLAMDCNKRKVPADRPKERMLYNNK
jgi:hypothetical protein